MNEDSVTSFNGLLAQRLQPGHYFDIDVTVVKNPKSFHISLASDKLNKYSSATICLNVLVKFDEYKILAHNQGRDEDSADFYSLSDDINVNIQVYDEIFQISINGDAKLKLPFRDDFLPWKAIQIAGDIKFIRRVDHRKILPTVWPPSKCIPYYPAEMYCSNDIPIPLKPGHLMIFTGRCYGQPTGNFYINLKHAHNESLLMHMSVDFKAKTVFRSHLDPIEAGGLYSHGFSANQTLGGFPFDFNKLFRIGIACKSSEFLVAVNGLYLFSFAYTNPENRHGSAIVPRPYTDVLSNIVGPKVFSRHGAGIKITEIDHIVLDNPECTTFEKYTQLEQCSD